MIAPNGITSRGTNYVSTMCKNYDALPPTFEERLGFLIVTFKAQMIQGGDADSRERADQIRMVEKTREKILGAIRTNPFVTAVELAQESGMTIKGIEWNLKRLKDAGIIRRVGPDKGGHWELVK